jgi:hypothetical protein
MIQINLGGRAEDEAMLLADLEAVLASFEGKSNWLTDAERSERLGEIVGTVAGVVAGAAVVVFLLQRQRRRRKQQAAP